MLLSMYSRSVSERQQYPERRKKVLTRQPCRGTTDTWNYWEKKWYQSLSLNFFPLLMEATGREMLNAVGLYRPVRVPAAAENWLVIRDTIARLSRADAGVVKHVLFDRSAIWSVDWLSTTPRHAGVSVCNALDYLIVPVAPWKTLLNSVHR